MEENLSFSNKAINGVLLGFYTTGEFIKIDRSKYNYKKLDNSIWINDSK